MVRFIPFTSALLVAVCSTLTAGIVYDNGPPDGGAAGISDFDPADANSRPEQKGDDFALLEDAGITDLHWWGVYLYEGTPPLIDTFSLRIFETSDTDGTPATTPLHDFLLTNVTRSATGDQILGLDVYEYEAMFATIALAADEYLLSIVANTINEPDTWAWVTTSATTAQSYSREEDGDDWVELAFEFAFQLTDDKLRNAIIPEPATLSLLALGGLGLLRRRRRT
jgi:hypothetical protein